MEIHGDLNPRSPQRGGSLRVVVALAIVFGLVAGFSGSLLALWTVKHFHSPLLYAGQSNGDESFMPTGIDGDNTPNRFEMVADQLDESVVNINTTSQSSDPFAQLFGGGSQVVKGLGTGVIVDTDGYILTNFHVVGNANKIVVTVMHKGVAHTYPGKLVGGDQQEDLAVIKITANGFKLKPVKFEDSNALRPGEWVMAIGNPYGFEHSVSVGVVSALNRPLQVNDAVSYRKMIQTDASINPGNSGGPLVNLRGEVIGINSAVFVGGGGGEPQAKGIGFAIPSNQAVKVMKQLRDHKTIAHPYIGIKYEALTDDIRNRFHIPAKVGVIIDSVLPDGPAAKAGVLAQDVITSIDGKDLSDRNALSDYINGKEVGDTATLSIQRWDESTQTWSAKTLRVTLDNKPSNLEQPTQPRSSTPDSGGNGLPFPPW